MNWISVEDRLPDTKKELLLYGHILCLGFYNKQLDVFYTSDEYETIIYDVVYWCEITEPSE